MRDSFMKIKAQTVNPLGFPTDLFRNVGTLTARIQSETSKSEVSWASSGFVVAAEDEIKLG